MQQGSSTEDMPTFLKRKVRRATSFTQIEPLQSLHAYNMLTSNEMFKKISAQIRIFLNTDHWRTVILILGSMQHMHQTNAHQAFTIQEANEPSAQSKKVALAKMN